MTLAQALAQTASSTRTAQDNLNDLLLKLQVDPTRDLRSPLAQAASAVNYRGQELQSYIDTLKRQQTATPNDAEVKNALTSATTEMSTLKNLVDQVNGEIAKTSSTQRLGFDATTGACRPVSTEAGSAQPNNPFTSTGKSMTDDLSRASAGQGLSFDQPPLDPKLANSPLYKAVDTAIRSMLGLPPSTSTPSTSTPSTSTPGATTSAANAAAGQPSSTSSSPRGTGSSGYVASPGGAGSSASPSGAGAGAGAGAAPSVPLASPSTNTSANSSGTGTNRAASSSGSGSSTPSASRSAAAASSTQAAINQQSANFLFNLFMDAIKKNADNNAKQQGRPSSGQSGQSGSAGGATGGGGAGNAQLSGSAGGSGGVDGSGSADGSGAAGGQDVGGSTLAGSSATPPPSGGGTLSPTVGGSNLAAGAATPPGTGLAGQAGQGLNAVLGLGDNSYLGYSSLGDEDVNSIIMAVMLGIYKDGQAQLKDEAKQMKSINDQKKAIRQQRDALRSGEGMSDDQRKDLDKQKQDLSDQLDSLGDDQQQQQLRLQDITQKQQELLSMITGIMKNAHDSAMSIIRHIGG